MLLSLITVTYIYGSWCCGSCGDVAPFHPPPSKKHNPPSTADNTLSAHDGSETCGLPLTRDNLQKHLLQNNNRPDLPVLKKGSLETITLGGGGSTSIVSSTELLKPCSGRSGLGGDSSKMHLRGEGRQYTQIPRASHVAVAANPLLPLSH